MNERGVNIDPMSGMAKPTPEQQLNDFIATDFETQNDTVKSDTRAAWLRHQFNAKQEGRDCKLTIADVYGMTFADRLVAGKK